MSAIVILENDGYIVYALGPTIPGAALPVDFPYFFPDEVTLTRTETNGTVWPLIAGIHYTLAGNPADDGFVSGAVTLLAAGFSPNCTIAIRRALRDTKATNFPEMGAISIPGMNTLFSRLFSWVQDLRRVTTGADRPPPSYDMVIEGLGYVPVNKAGDTVTGPLNVNGLLQVGGGANLSGGITILGPTQVPDQVLGDSDSSAANTRFVQSQGFMKTADANTAFAPISHSHPQSQVTNLVSDLALKAPLASPGFSGTPTTPDPPPGSNNQTVSNTKFVQDLVAGIASGLILQGNWNAATNTPALTSGVGTTGHYYIISVSGTTMLDGNSSWFAGDYVFFSGAAGKWLPLEAKIDSAQVVSALGYTPANKAGDTFAGTVTAPSIVATGSVMAPNLWRQLVVRTLSAAADCQFKSDVIPADIAHLMIEYSLVPATNDVDLMWQFYDGTGTILNTAGTYSWNVFGAGHTIANDGNVPSRGSNAVGITNGIVLTYSNTNTKVSSSAHMKGKIDIPFYKLAGTRKAVFGVCYYLGGGGTAMHHMHAAGDYTTAATVISGGRLIFGAGNISGGQATLWGAP